MFINLLALGIDNVPVRLEYARVEKVLSTFGCHFSRDDFLEIFRFLDLNRLSLQTCNEFGGAILVFDVYISACLLAFECAISWPVSL